MDRRGSVGRRIMWGLLIAGFIALPFLSAPGKYVFDTRDSAWFHPATYLARALALWRDTPYLGQEQHDGIMVPMGVGVWLLRSAGFPVWVTERLWHGLLLLTTAGTTIFLVDGLRERRTIIAPLTAGLAYTFTPYVIGYGLPFTPVFLPYVLLPLLLLVTLKGAGTRGLLWPALFGVVTFLMGGGNGAPQIYVLIASLTLMAWLVFAQRRVTLRHALRFAVWSLAFFVGLNAYWLFLLTSPEVFNALKFSEQPNVINVTSSASEALRGLGYWALYGGDQLGPWITTVRPYLTSPVLVFTGLVVPLAALISAWLVKWSFRLYFLLLAVVAVFVSMGLFPVHSPSPFGRLLLWSYDHVPGVAGLRTTYKVTAELNLAVAILAGVGLEALFRRLALARRTAVIRAAVLGVAVVVIGANGYPLWMGRLYNPARGTAGVPAYWEQALNTLQERDANYRSFFAPATSWTAYRWGSIKETVLATDPRLNAVYPLRLPIAQRYGSNLVAAIEAPYLDGASARGTARLLRLLGVQDVVLQNDIDWVRSRTARPSELQALLDDPDLQQVLRFGRPGENVTGGSADQIPEERALSPVQVLAVRDPVPMVRAEGTAPVVLSGDGFGIAAAAREELLPDGAPLLYSGALTTQDLQALLSQADPSFIVTDSNRRRVWYFSAPRAPRSYTLPAGQTIGGRPIGYLLFDDRADTQSIVVYPGVRSITASGYGSVFGTSPQFRPANAFDGDLGTWWVAGTGSNPQDAWIQAVLARPMLLSSVSITQPDAWWLREIRTVRLTFSDGSSVLGRLARGRTATINFPARMSSSLRITNVAVAGEPSPPRRSGAALADIRIPGLRPAETIRVPTDLFRAATRIAGGMDRLATLPFTYVFERARSYYRGGPDEEVRISRRFEVAGNRSFTLSGRVRLNRIASDAQLDQALFGLRGVVATSSSRFLGNPAFRGSSALDGDPVTRWQPSGAEGEWLNIRFPARVIDRIVVNTDAREGLDLITRIRAVFGDGSQVAGVISDPSNRVITLRFPPRRATEVTLFVDRVFTPFARGRPGPVGISEVRIPGVQPLRADQGAPLPCSNASVTIDGRPVSVKALGTVGDLLEGKRLELATCDRLPVTLTLGAHELHAGGGLQPDLMMLSAGGPAVEPASRLPEITSSRKWGGELAVEVRDAREPFYLVIGQNFDRRWKASVDGRDLGPPLLLDGFSAGWRIDRAGTYTVSVRYGQQRLYRFAVGLSCGALAFASGAVVVGLFRRRRRSRARWDLATPSS